MRPRFVGRLGVADAVTVGNAALGFLAVVASTVDLDLAARFILLAGVADGLDGVLARRYGGTAAGPYLDSLADVASFGVAPAVIVATAARREWGDATAAFADPTTTALLALAGVVVPGVYVAMAVTRLGLYTAYDTDSDETHGVPTTLSATIFGAAVLTGTHGALFMLAIAAIMTPLMVTDITYPDLHATDAAVMGVVQMAAILVPGEVGRGFAFGLLYLALAYMTLAPRFYWRR